MSQMSFEAQIEPLAEVREGRAETDGDYGLR